MRFPRDNLSGQEIYAGKGRGFKTPPAPLNDEHDKCAAPGSAWRTMVGRWPETSVPALDALIYWICSTSRSD
jgi:hypothetical protein